MAPRSELDLGDLPPPPMLLVIRLLQHQTDKFRRMRHRRSVTARQSAPRGSPCSCRKWPFAPSCPFGPSSQAVSAAQTGSRTHRPVALAFFDSNGRPSPPEQMHRRPNHSTGRAQQMRHHCLSTAQQMRQVRSWRRTRSWARRPTGLQGSSRKRARRQGTQEPNQRIDSSIDANYASEAVNMRK